MAHQTQSQRMARVFRDWAGTARKACFLAFIGGSVATSVANARPDSIDFAMQYLADLRDSPECAVVLDGEGRFDFGAGITNPSVACPDACAWKIFTEAVRGEFWASSSVATRVLR